MKRRFVPALLAVLLLFCATPLSPAARAFSDTDGSWAAQTIDKAASYGLMQGYPDGTFGVGKFITRGEFVTILGRMFAWESVSPAQPSYIDCPADKWCYAAVETARAHDVMEASGAFRPDDDISREEIAVMLVRALGYDGLARSLAELALPFADVKDNAGYIAMAYDLGIITGVQAGDALQFRPSFSAYREEAAAMLVRCYERLSAKVDWLHGFYAFSSYSQISLTAAMDGVSVGWASLAYDAQRGPWLNSTAEGGNDWIKPSDPTPATDFFAQHSLPYNLNVFASAGDKVTLPDGSETSTVAAVVSDAGRSAAAVEALVAASADYAGLTIDFEGLREGLKADYAAFMAALRAALPADKTLYVCVQPGPWYLGYDFKALGESCDKVIYMVHDYQWTDASSNVGTANTNSPVTPFPDVYKALRAITDPAAGVQDRSKIALAISFGTAALHIDENGYLLDGTVNHPAQETLAQRLAQDGTVVTYDETYRNPYAIYTTEDGTRYKVWYEDERSVTDKLLLARMFGINGVSLWRIGNIPTYGNYDVWSAVLGLR